MTRALILAMTLALLGCASNGNAARCDFAAPQAPGDAACAMRWMDANLRINDLQAIGTHNSYKEAIAPSEFAVLNARNPLVARMFDYAHPPLTEQLEAGARQIELDIVHDPEGGRYAAPLGLQMARERGEAAAFDASALAAPGFKVLHAQDLDYRSSCLTFVACLREIRDWSAAHPRHVPILIMLNLKRGPSPIPGGVAALDLDAAAFDALDAEIRTVFPARALITPDDVQGAHPTLREAVLSGAWPTLGEARGRVLFALDESAEMGEAYRGARANLEGRVLFVNAADSSPVAAYMTINDPVADGARIREMVSAGYLVRTRADADTWEARRNDTRRREAALASGAQYVSTDYMRPRTDLSDYSVSLPEIARCNPARAAPRCAGQAPEPR